MSTSQTNITFDSSLASWLKDFDISYYIADYWDEGADQRFQSLPLIGGGPWRLCAILIAYLIIVLWLGPRYMKNRPPYDLRHVLRAYNFGLVAMNAYLFYHCSVITKFTTKMWGCPDPYWPFTPFEIWMLYVGFMMRLMELMDTVFFVLRKKSNQVSFLHLFHHSIVPPLAWYGLKHGTHPALVFAPYVNTFVHVVMFAYYGLSTFKSPALQGWLASWKPHLTKLQMAQFVAIMIHGSQILVFRNCQYPALFRIQAIIGMVFFGLFMSFYVNAYLNRKDKAKSSAAE